MLAIVVEFRVVPARRSTFLDRVSENARQSILLEKGCHRFDVCVDPGDETAVFLYEVYRDAESFEGHLASSHYAAFDIETRSWVTSKVVRTLDLRFNSSEAA